MSHEPSQIWWSASEIADARLPDMPSTKRRVNATATKQGWQHTVGLSRRRKGHGGGWEYHWTLLPLTAQTQLLRAARAEHQIPGADHTSHEDRDVAWTFYDGLKQSAKDTAHTRLKALHSVRALEQAGLIRDAAVTEISKDIGKSARTIWTWFSLVEGVADEDWLAYLAPRHRKTSASRKRVTIDPDFGRWFKSDYLRLSGPPLTDCYDRAADKAREDGLPVPNIQTVRRWVNRTISKPVMTYLREGPDALKRLYPPQTRDKTCMHAMEGVNGDFHRFDVFVKFPGRNGAPDEIHRPQMCAFQDVYSGRIMCWRVATSANSHTVQLAIGDMIENWGIPKNVLLDNGREFAAIAITGGAPTRNRFKIKDDDIPGLLTAMGCKIHWATPYSGQSKPIERAFRDLCTRIAKHPSFEGAYTGNKPDAQPENYGERAVPLDEFMAVLDVEMDRHNHRSDRRSEVAYGRSFVEAFDESYKTAPIRMATQEQRRFWLMGVEGLHADRKNGQLNFMGSRYWAEWMYDIAGQKVVARFDREALWDGLHLYDLDNQYLGHAPALKKGKFFDVDDANYIAKRRNAFMRKAKAAAMAEERLTAAELAVEYGQVSSPEAETAERSVVAPDFGAERDRKDTREVRKTGETAPVVDMTTRLSDTVPPRPDEPTKLELFYRAMELEELFESGKPITRDQDNWLKNYQQSDDYRGHVRMYEVYGDSMFAGITKTGEK